MVAEVSSIWVVPSAKNMRGLSATRGVVTCSMTSTVHNDSRGVGHSQRDAEEEVAVRRRAFESSRPPCGGEGKRDSPLPPIFCSHELCQ
jgi:hypothetical protein